MADIPELDPKAEQEMRQNMAAMMATNPALRADLAKLFKDELLRSWREGLRAGMRVAAKMADGLLSEGEPSAGQKAVAIGLRQSFLHVASLPDEQLGAMG